MDQVYDKLVSCYNSIRSRIDFVPDIAVVLGSGLGDYGKEIRVEAELSYTEIEGFPVSTVPGHAGKFIFGFVGEAKVVCMQGRVHYYEGYPISDVVLPTRLMKMLGAKILVLTNASGGINPSFTAGDFMMLTDH
ncbi:MAG: purine-nucleoside phosphorylase, partial [Lachnospiraceae bacterium]